MISFKITATVPFMRPDKAESADQKRARSTVTIDHCTILALKSAVATSDGSVPRVALGSHLSDVKHMAPSRDETSENTTRTLTKQVSAQSETAQALRLGSMSVSAAAQHRPVRQQQPFASLRERGWITSDEAPAGWDSYGDAIARRWLVTSRKIITYQDYVVRVIAGPRGLTASARCF